MGDEIMLYCMLCKRGFIVKRTLSNLFTKYNYLICDLCYEKNKLDLCLSSIPLDNRRMLHIITLLSPDKIMNYKAFIHEYGMVLSKYLYRNPIVMDRVFLNKTFIDNMNNLSMIIEDDVYVVAYKMENSF